MSGEGYIPGDWWVLCDACQRKVRSSKVSKRPTDGLLVHSDPAEGCWETRHPQEFVRSVPDNQPLPFTRPDNDGVDMGSSVTLADGYTFDGSFTVPSLIDDAAWAEIPAGTFQTTDYDWE